MNQHHSFWWTWIMVAVLLPLPIFAIAQSPYEGIYFGTYDGDFDNGEFALIVDRQGHAILAAYDAVDDVGYLEKKLAIRADGSFEFVTHLGAHIEGRVAADGVSGAWHVPGTGGHFGGERMPDEGSMEHAAGFYSGYVAVTRPGSALTDYGRMTAVVSGDGRAFFLIDQSVSSNAGPGSGEFDFDLDLGLEIDVDANFGAGSNSDFGSGHGACFPFFSGGSYSFVVSVAFIDFRIDYRRPSCNPFWRWSGFGGLWNKELEAFQYSGGLIRIDSNGFVEDFLLDGLKLEGYLDAQSGKMEGIVSQSDAFNSWSGYWSINRQYDTHSIAAVDPHKRLVDMNGDGNADILWHHTLTGANTIWLMQGTEVATEQPLQQPEEARGNAAWSLEAVAQLNTDEYADYLWRNSETGSVLLQFGNDAGSATFELDPAYQVVGNGDFDADGVPDILLRHRTSNASAVITNLAATAGLNMLPEIGGPHWTSVSVADFDGDRAPDILFMNRQTHELLIQLMSGLQPGPEIRLRPSHPGHIELAGVGDFDRDGSTDILQRDLEDDALIMTRNLGEAGGEDIVLGSEVPRGWQLAAVGDVDGDGGDDLIWRQSATGENVGWRFIAAGKPTVAPVAPVADLNWRIQQ